MRNLVVAPLVWPARLIARAPLSISTKLLVAFLVIVGLLVVVGAVALQELAAVNRRAEDGAVDHLNLTSLIDSRGRLRGQYLGYRFRVDELLADLQALLRE